MKRKAIENAVMFVEDNASEIPMTVYISSKCFLYGYDVILKSPKGTHREMKRELYNFLSLFGDEAVKADIHDAPILEEYKGLKGKDFLVSYFRHNGVTEDEIELYFGWGMLDGCHNLMANSPGINYASECVESMINYRNITVQDIREKGIDCTPWAWPSAMAFHKFDPGQVHYYIPGIQKIFMIEYKGQCYYFNIGKEEPQGEELKEICENGKWYIYTYSD